MLNVGDKAPEFTLPNQEGVLVSLSDFGGTQVVVWFFPIICVVYDVSI